MYQQDDGVLSVFGLSGDDELIFCARPSANSTAVSQLSVSDEHLIELHNEEDIR